MSNLIWPKLTRLAECLCKAVNDSELDELCFCGVQPGSNVAYDFINGGCEGPDGMGWVRLTNGFLTARFPQPLTTEARCGSELAFSAEVGIVRTMPVGEDGEPPTAAQFLAAAERQITEMALIREALTCCFRSGIILTGYQPIGPDGGALGGLWNVVVPTLEDDD